MNPPDFVYVTYIRAEIDQVWEALTLPEFTERYFHGMKIEAEWRVGGRLRFLGADGKVGAEGEILELDRPRRLSFGWHVEWSPEMAAEEPSRVSYELEEAKGATRLTVIHDRFPEGSAVHAAVSGGWPSIVASLKSMLETGEPLEVVVS
jgi:uncharacterized protein YndB with AHSA1/START domain